MSIGLIRVGVEAVVASMDALGVERGLLRLGRRLPELRLTPITLGFTPFTCFAAPPSTLAPRTSSPCLSSQRPSHPADRSSPRGRPDIHVVVDVKWE